jgi:integrase
MSTFYKEWMAACERAGVSDLNPHCLRHTGATRAYWATGDIYYVSKLLNHANVETTVKY